MENNRQQNEEVAVNEKTLSEAYAYEPTRNEELDIDLSGFEDDIDIANLTKDDNENSETNDEAEQEQPEELDFDLTSLIPSISNMVNRIREAGVLSVVNPEKNGKRVAIASDVISRLGQPQTLQVGFNEGNLVLGEYLGDEYTSYTLRKQAAKHIIYNKELVEQITKHCGLDFSERTSITFPKATYLKMADEVIVIISMN